MFGFPLLIIVIAALIATGLAAVGLRLFFRLLEPVSSVTNLPTGEQTPGGE